MMQPRFEPQPDNTFRIIHDPFYFTSVPLLRKVSARELEPNDAVQRLREVLAKYPYHFEVALALADLYTSQGNFDKACDTRYKACQQIIRLLPDEEEEEEAEVITLDFEQTENQHLLFLLQGSAIDHFLIGDFEMAAGLLETLLELDEEDHLNASQTLAYCYIPLGESELFEALLPDLDDKSAEKMLVRLWAAQHFGKAIDPALLAEFKRNYPAVYAEFTADNHDVSEAYLADIDSERPSQAARARLLWLQTEHLWKQYPEFIKAFT